MADQRAGRDKQMELFGEKSLNPTAELKRAMSLALKESGLTREEAAERLNAIILLERLRTRGKDGRVTLDILNKWLAPEATDQVIPVKLLPAFCRAVGSLKPLQALAAPLGGLVIGAGEQALLHMAQAVVAEKDARRRRLLYEEKYREMRP